MPRRLCLILIAAASLQAALLPDKFGAFTRQSTSGVELPEPHVWREFGLEASEQASYAPGSGQGPTVQAYRFKDLTGAYAAQQWQRRGERIDNYLIIIQGSLAPEDTKALYAGLPNRVSSALPPLTEYLPRKRLQSGSERYSLGPASLALFEPRLPASQVNFDLGAELQLARYKTAGGETQLVLISYPTLQIAAKQFRVLEAIPEAAVKREGPIVAVAFPKSDASAAVLEAVKYAPRVTWAEQITSDTPQDAANMFLAVFTLAGVLIVASVLFGMAFGGFRLFRGRFGMKDAQDSITSLHLDGK
ncbi:MAG TPA: hypothetical protein VEQ63_10215 [Bryobacteraceae bacterium]|nr:hypothetical protein [Bryobacteraceae bacterium]